MFSECMILVHFTIEVVLQQFIQKAKIILVIRGDLTCMKKLCIYFNLFFIYIKKFHNYLKTRVFYGCIFEPCFSSTNYRMLQDLYASRGFIFGEGNILVHFYNAVIIQVILTTTNVFKIKANLLWMTLRGLSSMFYYCATTTPHDTNSNRQISSLLNARIFFH